jgi:hypothetical protein
MSFIVQAIPCLMQESLTALSNSSKATKDNVGCADQKLEQYEKALGITVMKSAKYGERIEAVIGAAAAAVTRALPAQCSHEEGAPLSIEQLEQHSKELKNALELLTRLSSIINDQQIAEPLSRTLPQGVLVQYQDRPNLGQIASRVKMTFASLSRKPAFIVAALSGIGATVACREQIVEEVPRYLVNALLADLNDTLTLGVGEDGISSKSELDSSLGPRHKIKAITLGQNFHLRDEDLFVLADLKFATNISVNGAPNLTGGFLKYFQDKPLWKVRLENLRNFKQESLVYLTDSKTLQHLSVFNCDLGKEAFERISQMKGLTTLCLAEQNTSQVELWGSLINSESQLRTIIIHSPNLPSPDVAARWQQLFDISPILESITFNAQDGRSIEFLRGSFKREY